jgi:hypothetical protein
MDAPAEENARSSATHNHRLVKLTLDRLPDRCAADVNELAELIQVDKLELIQWMRADIGFARLVASKVAT